MKRQRATQTRGDSSFVVIAPGVPRGSGGRAIERLTDEARRSSRPATAGRSPGGKHRRPDTCNDGLGTRTPNPVMPDWRVFCGPPDTPVDEFAAGGPTYAFTVRDTEGTASPLGPIAEQIDRLAARKVLAQTSDDRGSQRSTRGEQTPMAVVIASLCRRGSAFCTGRPLRPPVTTARERRRVPAPPRGRLLIATAQYPSSRTPRHHGKHCHSAHQRASRTEATDRQD